MGCEKLNAPGGISDALKGAGNLITQNLRAAAGALNPMALTSKIQGALTDIADNITGSVTSAIDGVSNLKNLLPGADVDDVASQIGEDPTTTRLSFMTLSKKRRCDNNYIKEAGKVNNNIKEKSQQQASSLTEKDKRDMSNNSETKQTKTQEIEAQVTTQALQDIEQQTQQEDKEERSVQDEIQSLELETVQRGFSACDRENLTGLLHQMSFLQTQIYLILNDIKNSMESVITDALFPGRFNRAPVFDMWLMLHHTALFRCYSGMAQGLIQVWKDQCKDNFPEKDTQFGTHYLASTFGEFMQITRSSKYGTTGSVRTYTHDESRWTGDQMLTEYFKLWDGTSWVYNDVNSDGVVPDLIDSSLAGETTKPGTLNITDFFTGSEWFTTFDTYRQAGYSHRTNIMQDLLDYITNEQQPEILQFFGLPTNTDRVVIGVKNDTKQPNQIYDRDFVIEATIDYDNYIIENIIYLGDDTKTKDAVEF